MTFFVKLSIPISILISDIPSTTKATNYNFNTNIAVDSQKENARYPTDIKFHPLYLYVAFICLLICCCCYCADRKKRQRTRRTESNRRENSTLPFYHRYFGNTDVPSTSSSNFVQIPIEAPVLNQIESVSNRRVSHNPLENTDPRLSPPPSYEEVIVTNESTEEPPPTYLESFFFADYFGFTKFAMCLSRSALIFEQEIQIS